MLNRNSAIAILIFINFIALGRASAEIEGKKYDSSFIVGHLSFKEGESEAKAIEIATHLSVHFPDFMKVFVRKNGSQSYGMDFTYDAKNKIDSKSLAKGIKNSIEQTFGKNILTKWDISSRVYWIKNSVDRKFL